MQSVSGPLQARFQFPTPFIFYKPLPTQGALASAFALVALRCRSRHGAEGEGCHLKL